MANPSTLVGRKASRGGARTSGARGSSEGERGGHHVVLSGPRLFLSVPLPADGALVIGRGDEADVRVADPRTSRLHARVSARAGVFTIEDLGSANGTRVRDVTLGRGQKAAVLAGEVVSIGALSVIVQPDRGPAQSRTLLPHAEFESRVEWECARAEATGLPFSVLRARATGALDTAQLHEMLAVVLRALDLVGQYARAECEVLLPGSDAEAAQAVVDGVEAHLATHGAAGAVAFGMATYPRDGRHAGALIARAAPADGVRPRPTGERPGHATLVNEAMKRVYALAERAAAGSITVLILGETGVGKDVLARSIHELSPRSAQPYVCINCAAVSESLMESELFGHERGAFTGAGNAKPGLLETAPGGTVFLDEVGELPPTLQAKLLRVLETREVTRVGGVRARRLDVRFVAATNRDLEAEVERGAFRRDLFYRLCGMTLTIPPLRERRDDIPALVRCFAGEFSADRRRPVAFSREAVEVLAGQDWPGNVRQLRDFIQRTLLLVPGDRIDAADLPFEERPAVSVAAAAPAERAGNDTVERVRFLQALAACGGNQSRAARMLGVSRKVLIARLDAWGVARPRKAGSP